MRKILLFILLLGTALITHAQDQTVSGKITDESGAGLPGASILIKGTTRGTMTDGNGQFSIAASPESVLQISSIGYAAKEIPVGNQQVINQQMQLDITQLNEVVVTGYSVE